MTLAGNARYCMQCGTPTEPPARLAQLGNSNFAQPALIGGAAIGVLSSLPFVNLGNCICCMWVIGGGALASWLLIKQHPGGTGGVTYGDGAFVGVLSGIVGAIIGTLISLPFRLLAADGLRSQQEAIEELLNEYPEMEGPIRELILRLLSPEISFTTVLVNLFMNLVVFSLFAMIGGIVMVAVLKKDGQPVVPPQVPGGSGQ